jgi:hypothetical protein
MQESKQIRSIPATPWLASATRRQGLFGAFLAVCLVGSLAATQPWVRVLMLAGAIAATAFAMVEVVGVTVSRAAENRARRRTPASIARQFTVPNAQIHGEDVKRLFAHPAMATKTPDGTWRSAGVLRQLLYWLHAPADCHQEVMEHDEFYPEFRQATTRVLARPMPEVRSLLKRHIDAGLEAQSATDGAWAIRWLGDVVNPMVVGFYYELLLGTPAEPNVLSSMCACLHNLIESTRGQTTRDMSLRETALQHLRAELSRSGGRPEVFGEDCSLSIDQRARYVLTVWIHTASAQTTRLAASATCHAARQRRCIDELRREGHEPGPYAEAVLLESLRLTPGTAMTNRVAGDHIRLSDGVVIPHSTDVLFDLRHFHRSGFEAAAEFIPERWFHENRKSANFMPYGVGKRRCPAERFATVVATDILMSLVTTYDLVVPADRRYIMANTPKFRVSSLCCLARRNPPLPRVLRLGIAAWLAAAVRLDGARRAFAQWHFLYYNAGAAFDAHRDALARQTENVARSQSCSNRPGEDLPPDRSDGCPSSKPAART